MTFFLLMSRRWSIMPR